MDTKISFKKIEKGNFAIKINKISKWATISLFLSIIIVGIIASFFDLPFNHVSYSSNGGWFTDEIVDILLKVLASIIGVVAALFYDFFAPIMDAFQDAIFILLSGQWISSSINITYLDYLRITSILFIFFLIIFIVITMFTKNTEQIAIRLIKSIFSFIMIPVALLGVFALVSWFSYLISGSFLNNRSISDIIDSVTFQNIPTTTPAQSFFYGLIGIGCVLFVFKYFLEFCIYLALRIYELITYGTIGIIFASAGMVSDGGKRLSTYSSVMLTKIANAFICLLGYLFIINILEPITNWINNTELDPHYSTEDYLKTIIQVSVIIASFLLLKSLSTEYAFTISGSSQGAMATQLNQVRGAASMIMQPISKFKNLATKPISSTMKKMAPKELIKSAKAKESFKNSPKGLSSSLEKAISGKSGKDRENAEAKWLKENTNRIKKVADKASATTSVAKAINEEAMNSTNKEKGKK